MNRPNMELPFDKLPKLWVHSYPFIRGGMKNGEETYRAFLSDTNAKQPGLKGLYVHIPFCDTICSFCPFVRSTNYGEKLRPYLDALIQEIRMTAAMPYVQKFELNAIYIGGGTPSVLTPEMILELCNAITENFRLTPDCEFTFEVEAKSATEDKLQAAAKGGVNRISYGVQTFDPNYRKLFNLTASLEEVKRTTELGLKYFKAVNIDLLYQLPGQTMEMLQADLESCFELGATSVDAFPIDYLLTSKGFLGRMNDGRTPMPPNPIQRMEMNRFVNQFFLANGYEHTYIYTFTRGDAKYKPYQFGEVIYGRYQDEMLGVGQSALSALAGIATRNYETTEDYIRAVEAGKLPVEHFIEYHAKEKCLITFPKRMEMNIDDLNNLGLEQEYYDKLDRYESMGLIKRENGEMRLTEEGCLWYMNMMVDLMPEDQRRIYDSVGKMLANAKNWHDTLDLVTIED